MSALLLVVAAAVFKTFVDTREIRRKERELQLVNEEMERFAYTVTHDLKGPVVTIKTYLNFLLHDISQNAPPERIEKNVSYIRGAADRMGKLLDELMRMSLLGRHDTPAVKMFYNALVAEATDAVAGRIAERGVQLNLMDEELILNGDRSRLLELWQNLVDNAVKYMGEQTAPKIDVGFEGSGREIEFFVRDNGLGIAPEYQTKIFGIFEKLDGDSEGTGMGLAVVKKIVDLYHGKIWVESAGRGTGSIFKFTLPDAVRGHKKSNSF
jgi:signal transduction histidine kinase